MENPMKNGGKPEIDYKVIKMASEFKMAANM